MQIKRMNFHSKRMKKVREL